MRTRGRRRLDVGLLSLGAMAGGGLVALGGVVGDAERVTQMWVGAQLTAEGDAKVVEVVDYDFGTIAIEKHGIFRTIPELTIESPVSVRSASAPDDIAERLPHVFEDGRLGVKLKIGDRDTTIYGRHRYKLGYGLQDLSPGGALDWDPVGPEWTVDIGQSEIHVVAPWEFENTRCFIGSSGSTDECTATELEPGHLIVRTARLASGEGVSIESGRGADLATAPSLPAPPLSAPPDPGIGVALPAVAALVAGLGGALSTSMLVRRSGRDRVGAGGVADAAWAGGGGPAGEVRLDETDLAGMATTEFAPPSELSAAQGGVLLAERVRPEHKVAWLIQAAIDGAVELVEQDGKKVKLVWTGKPGPGHEPLATAFAGRAEIDLGQYDPVFAAGWAQVGQQLETWHLASGLWDPAGDRRRSLARWLGAGLAVLGALLAFAGGYASSRWGRQWIVVVVCGSLLAGGAWAALLRGWELRVRTPQGSALWLRVESFRRFLHQSETFHAEEAAKRGVLREYTAWAVALDEIDRWERAVAGSSIIPADAGLSYVHVAPILSHSASAAATAPSSSGGGGGGSVGGGGGGGGGGSW